MITTGPTAVQPTLDAILGNQQSIELPLHEEGGQWIGVMRPFTADHLKQMDVLVKLTAWRNTNMANFLTHFVASPERTRVWVEDVLLKARGQMLWLVYDHEQLLVGHFGFKNLTADSVLLDNAMRGERQGHPKLFVCAGKALVQWLFTTTVIQRIDAYVMADNVPAIMMNRQIGFGGWMRHPLIRRAQESEVHWDMGEAGQASPDGRYCFILSIKRNTNSKGVSISNYCVALKQKYKTPIMPTK